MNYAAVLGLGFCFIYLINNETGGKIMEDVKIVFSDIVNNF